MRENNGPHSGLTDDLNKSVLEGPPKPATRARRIGEAVELLDEDGNRKAIMRAENFDSMMEELKK